MKETEAGEFVASLEWLIEISRSLNSTLSLRLLLTRIVTAAQELTDTEACSILLVDRESGQLHFEAATNLPGIRSIVVPVEGSVAGQVLQTGEPIAVQDTSETRLFYQGADAQSSFKTRSILAVPMIIRGNVIGVVEAVNKRAGEKFNDQDIEMLTVLGDQAAVAVQNALLFQQSDLVAEIVHEMRTPLASIIGYADLVRKPGVTLEQCAQFAEIIWREAGRLDSLASSFLDLARLESGRAGMDHAPVDLSTVVRMALSVLRPQANAKQIALSVKVPADLPSVIGDAQRLHQVMLNLVGNAIKYCNPGDNVTISAQIDEDCLSICVADTGPGISPDALPHLFERFYRVPGAEHKAGGTGLGLTISRQIVEAHGGEMSVSSEEGSGATFTFTLPLTSATASP